MSLKPLDLQVVLGQSDNVGVLYLKMYNAPRREQMMHGAHFERHTKEIDSKVLDLPEEINEYQETYLDPHDERNKRLYRVHKRPSKQENDDEESQFREPNKGHLVDVLR